MRVCVCVWVWSDVQIQAAAWSYPGGGGKEKGVWFPIFSSQGKKPFCLLANPPTKQIERETHVGEDPSPLRLLHIRLGSNCHRVTMAWADDSFRETSKHSRQRSGTREGRRRGIGERKEKKREKKMATREKKE
ncbi:uncharacterized protein LY79DRAFT_526657 [Colletotrichum navitas]|uniref:Uncharacterized protein n=1 Tax=Colletotrichum navitas TaxID=681940 RepID=A0AAD8V078_9PEZI|nr:uncharacterized protein LY79DRAFT_526657 [Colletotrichum navitas]KAK1572896.1 hypothetical protein LY79DRAFT_526657 [Colletotrichum navitas]